MGEGGEIAERVWLQVETGVDAERLLGSEDKRRRALAKKIDKGLEGKGWHVFAAGCAHAMAHGKAPQARNAEAALVREARSWLEQTRELLPGRTGEVRRIVAAALADPEPPEGGGGAREAGGTQAKKAPPAPAQTKAATAQPQPADAGAQERFRWTMGRGLRRRLAKLGIEPKTFVERAVLSATANQERRARGEDEDLVLRSVPRGMKQCIAAAARAAGAASASAFCADALEAAAQAMAGEEDAREYACAGAREGEEGARWSAHELRWLDPKAAGIEGHGPGFYCAPWLAEHEVEDSAQGETLAEHQTRRERDAESTQ